VNYFRDKVSLVTGGAAGIGAELARHLSAAGAVVIIADRDGEAAQTLADELGKSGARVRACRMDVSRFGEVKQAVDNAVAEFGRLDLIINNAGVGLAGELRDLELSDWQPLVDVNLWGVIHGVHAVLPVMLNQGSGQIVNIASAAGLVQDLGIRVNVVCPFNIATSIFKNTKFRNIDGEAMLAAVPLKQMPVDKCVTEMLRGIERDKAIISMPRFARFEWWLYRVFPRAASLLLRRRRSLFRDHRISPAAGGTGGKA
jgi:NAD(P)-dependent dehydrogenase (short-subunit alcohol dehydrogenase family)